MGLSLGLTHALLQIHILEPKLEVKPTHEIHLHCDICDASASLGENNALMYHCAWDCPKKVLADLMRCVRRLTDKCRYACPFCEKELGVNKRDFFECRSCHAQFVRSDASLKPRCTEEEFLVVDDAEDEAFYMRQLVQKGKGHFPEKAYQPAIVKAQRAHDRILRTLKSLRGCLAHQEIYFNGEEFFAKDYSSIGARASQVLRSYKYSPPIVRHSEKVDPVT